MYNRTLLSSNRFRGLTSTHTRIPWNILELKKTQHCTRCLHFDNYGVYCLKYRQKVIVHGPFSKVELVMLKINRNRWLVHDNLISYFIIITTAISHLTWTIAWECKLVGTIYIINVGDWFDFVSCYHVQYLSGNNYTYLSICAYQFNTPHVTMVV